MEEDRAMRRGVNVTLGKLMHREAIIGQEIGWQYLEELLNEIQGAHIGS